MQRKIVDQGIRDEGKVLEVKALTKRFGGVTATNNVSFHVNNGEKLGILGPNGAGKTTLFNQISGFIAPDKGSIFYKGMDIKKLKPHRRSDIGMVRTFQLVRPYKDMTVRENLIIPFLSPRAKRLMENSDKSLDETIDIILARVDLFKKKNALVSQLPHGELKKLEVAKVAVVKPEIIMLDEPFGGLSPGEIEILSDYINALNKEEGITFMIIEHRLREFMKIVERVVVLNYGELIAEGAPEEIVNNPLVIEAYLGKGGAKIASA
jgi:branched-chain amino acid transport system ATP-binding protein